MELTPLSKKTHKYTILSILEVNVLKVSTTYLL